MPSTQWTLQQQPEVYAICRLAPDQPWPAWLPPTALCSVTRTDQELSIICRQDLVPPNITCQSSWKCLRVAGPLDFSLVGVLASLTVPLRDAGVSVYCVSTYDTDYLFVRDNQWTEAIEGLRGAGHLVV